MELELGLALPNSDHSEVKNSGFDLDSYQLSDCLMKQKKKKKRGFDEVFGSAEKPTLMNLLQDEESDDNTERNRRYLNKKPKALVGWPPVKCMRTGKCVKVKMEGVGIGRKVDLSLHRSYQSLLNTLTHMFPKEQDKGMMKGSAKETLKNEYVVTYENEDGDRLLLGAVSWQTFIQSVKRLKILC